MEAFQNLVPLCLHLKNKMTSPATNSSGRGGPKVILHYWGRRGGGSQFTLMLAEHLRGPGKAADVTLSLSQHNEDMEAFRMSGLPIVTFDRPSLATLWRKGWLLPQQLKSHADTLASLKPDAVVMTMNSPFAWPFIRALQKRGLKVLYVAHDAEPHPGDYAATWQRMTQDLLIKNADGVIALSSSVAKRVVERIPAAEGKISVIPLETVYPTQNIHPRDWQPGDGPIRLLFYGRLLPYKGLDLLAEALEPLKAHPGWRLTVAGSGPLEETVRQVFAQWPQVELELGWITDRRTEELFSSHHLLLCPYIEASQSGVIAQAISWAMPSLVMPTGALPEQIGCGAAGIVAETMDANGFRHGLQTALEQPSRLAELSRGAAKLLVEYQNDQGWIRLIAGNTRAG